VDHCELPNGVDGPHGLIIKSNHFLERALTSLAQSDANLDLVDSVTSLEFASETSIRGHRQINAAVPIRNFSLGRRARGASRGQHRDGLKNRRFSAGVGANGAESGRFDGVNEPAERAEFVQLEDTQTHLVYCQEGVSGRR
jgi:hypothetical protein